MQNLHYTGDTVLMADDVCQAFLLYARALASTQSSDVVTVPIIDSGGSAVDAEFLLGPASQVYSTPAAGVRDLPGDPAVIAELHKKTRMLGPSMAMPLDEAPSTNAFDPDI